MYKDLSQHSHHFNQHKTKAGERRTWPVIILTSLTMAGEILAGVIFGSMALLADGLHMASHTTALLISAFAYFYARRHAHDTRFSFGTGKVGSLAGFSSAVLLAIFAIFMIGESLNRFLNPIDIAFDEAIIVAFIGLLVNLSSVFILRVSEHDSDDPAHGHSHDHNLKAAYLHVLADALTSLLAILALFGGKFYGLDWMDPLMGIVGAVMITRWSAKLLKETSRVLLDHQADKSLVIKVRHLLEADQNTRVKDLHIWSIGSNNYAAAINLISNGQRDSRYQHKKLQKLQEIVHCTIDVQYSAD